MFVITVSICIIFGAFYERAYSVLASRTYGHGPGPSQYVHSEWVPLGLPLRSIAVAMGSLAHWFFTETYFRLALTVPFLLN